ncbi:MAG: zinc ribbon domain-containing protein [Oscillospiraceae bacterium]|nr:zinc ribbon domain-containing protein [Oscillospiraceae bacterium]
MYCTQCGTQKPPNATYCPECGTAQAAQQPYPQAPYYYGHTQPYPNLKHPYQSIGGVLRWLQVSLIFSCIFLPILWAFNIFTFVRGEGDFSTILLNSTSMISGILTLVCMIMLLRRKPNFLRIYEISCLVMLGGLLLYDVYLLFTMGFAMFIVQLILTLFVVGAMAPWLLYYVRSVRVRTYMGSDAYIKQSIFLKRVTPPVPAVPDDNPSEQL